MMIVLPAGLGKSSPGRPPLSSVTTSVSSRSTTPVGKVAGVKDAIEAAGATLQYLPQYSPDLNPIEMPFSKFKAFLRKAAERTVGGLCRRIRSFVPTISRAECRNYFRHAGYAPI